MVVRRVYNSAFTLSTMRELIIGYEQALPRSLEARKAGKPTSPVPGTRFPGKPNPDQKLLWTGYSQEIVELCIRIGNDLGFSVLHVMDRFSIGRPTNLAVGKLASS